MHEKLPAKYRAPPLTKNVAESLAKSLKESCDATDNYLDKHLKVCSRLLEKEHKDEATEMAFAILQDMIVIMKMHNMMIGEAFAGSLSLKVQIDSIHTRVSKMRTSSTTRTLKREVSDLKTEFDNTFGSLNAVLQKINAQKSATTRKEASKGGMYA